MRYLLLLLLCACTSMTADEREEKKDGAAYKQNIDIENWAVCEKIYNRYNKPTMHVDHSHGRHDRIRPWMIKKDLNVNMCRGIMGESWIHH